METRCRNDASTVLRVHADRHNFDSFSAKNATNIKIFYEYLFGYHHYNTTVTNPWSSDIRHNLRHYFKKAYDIYLSPALPVISYITVYICLILHALAIQAYAENCYGYSWLSDDGLILVRWMQLTSKLFDE